MKWLVDNQLPHQLCTALKKRGHEAIHASELQGSHRTPDADICALADVEGRVVVTKDEDFVHAHATRNSPGKLVYVSTGNIRNQELIFLFMHWLDNLCEALQHEGLVELHRSGLIVR